MWTWDELWCSLLLNLWLGGMNAIYYTPMADKVNWRRTRVNRLERQLRKLRERKC